MRRKIIQNRADVPPHMFIKPTVTCLCIKFCTLCIWLTYSSCYHFHWLQRYTSPPSLLHCTKQKRGITPEVSVLICSQSQLHKCRTEGELWDVLILQNYHRMVWAGRDLTVKNFFLTSNLNLPSSTLKPLPLVLSPHSFIKSPSPPFL